MRYHQTTRLRFKRNAPSEKSTPESRWNSKSWLQNAAYLITLLSVVLTMFGYGFVTGLVGTFDFYAMDVYHTPLDFLGASLDASIYYIDGFMHILHDQPLMDELILWGCAFGLLCILVVIILWYGLSYIKKRNSKLKQLNVITSWLKKLHIRYFIKSSFAVFLAALSPALYVKGMAFILVLVIMVLMLPILAGYPAGKWTAKKYIITPLVCGHYSDTPQKPEIDTAICLRVLNKEGQEIARGRRIARNSEQLFLFNKHTGISQSIPIRDAIVEQVDSDCLTPTTFAHATILKKQLSRCK